MKPGVLYAPPWLLPTMLERAAKEFEEDSRVRKEVLAFALRVAAAATAGLCLP